MCPPAYQELLDKDIPKIEVAGGRVKVIAGESQGVTSPVRTRTPTMYIDITVKPGGTIRQVCNARLPTALLHPAIHAVGYPRRL